MASHLAWSAAAGRAPRAATPAMLSLLSLLSLLALLAMLAAGAAGCGGEGTSAADAAVPNAIAPRVYLNYEGGLFRAAEADDAAQNLTKITDADMMLRPHFEGDPERDAKNAAITMRIREQLAPYAIEIVTERPAEGTYHMIAITESSGGVATPPNRFISQTSRGCNEVASPISFVWEHQLPVRTEIITTAVIGLVGIANGVTDTSAEGDCMCWQDPCQILATPCVLKAAPLPTPDHPICGEPKTADSARAFRETFGVRE